MKFHLHEQLFHLLSTLRGVYVSHRTISDCLWSCREAPEAKLRQQVRRLRKRLADHMEIDSRLTGHCPRLGRHQYRRLMNGVAHLSAGKAGEHAAASEFLIRNWFVVSPAVDLGVDLLISDRSYGQARRVQVKTASAQEQRRSYVAQLGDQGTLLLPQRVSWLRRRY